MKLLHSTAIALFIVTGTTTAVLADEMASNPFQTIDVKNRHSQFR